MGTYRAGLKASDRLAVRMVVRPGGAEGYVHWKKWKERKKPMPCAIAVGCPPAVNFMSPQKLQMGIDEIDIAGGLVEGPINITKCKTIDLNVPAESELVIEGLISTESVEPEAPFGEKEFSLPPSSLLIAAARSVRKTLSSVQLLSA